MPPVLNDETTNGISIQITKCIANQLAQYEYDMTIKNNENLSAKEKERCKIILKESYFKDIGKEKIFDVSILDKIDIKC